MESWEYEMKKLFQRDKTPPAGGFFIGTVITGLPYITLSLGDEIILDSEQIIVANTLYSKNITTGNQIILIPSSDNQSYVAIDKVGG